MKVENVGVEEDYYCGRGRSVGFFGGADFSLFLDFCDVEALVGGGCFGICEICLGWLWWYLVKIDFWLGNKGFSIGSGLWFNNG